MTTPATVIDRSHATIIARIQAAMQEATIPEKVVISISLMTWGVHIYIGDSAPNAYLVESFDYTGHARRLAIALGLPDKPRSERKTKYRNSSKEWSSDYSSPGVRFTVRGYRDRGHRCTGTCPLHCGHDD